MINQLNLQRLQTAAGYRPWLDTRTTLPEQVPEYVESTMETFAYDILIRLNYLGTTTNKCCYYNATLTWSELGEKSNLRPPQFKINNRQCGSVSFFTPLKFPTTFRVSIHPYIVNL